MKSAIKKSVVSTSISLILASGMAAFAAHAADDVKLKATKTNVAFSDFTPTEYSTKGKPNIIVLTMDDLGYGQLPFDKGSFDPKTMENREVVDTYKIGIDKAIEAAQKSTPTLLSLMDEGVRFTNGYVAHGVSGPSRAAIMTGRAPARFGVYSNTDAQDGIPLTETFLPELFQNHGYYTAAVGKWHLSKISNVPVPEDKQTRDYHDNFTTFSAEEWQPQNRGFDYFMGFHAAGTAYYNSPSLFKNRERVPAKGYISDQLTDEAIGVVDRAKTLDQPFMLYLAYNAPHLPNDNPAPEQYQKQFNTGSSLPLKRIRRGARLIRAAAQDVCAAGAHLERRIGNLVVILNRARAGEQRQLAPADLHAAAIDDAVRRMEFAVRLFKRLGNRHHALNARLNQKVVRIETGHIAQHAQHRAIHARVALNLHALPA